MDGSDVINNYIYYQYIHDKLKKSEKVININLPDISIKKTILKKT